MAVIAKWHLHVQRQNIWMECTVLDKQAEVIPFMLYFRKPKQGWPKTSSARGGVKFCHLTSPPASPMCTSLPLLLPCLSLGTTQLPCLHCLSSLSSHFLIWKVQEVARKENTGSSRLASPHTLPGEPGRGSRCCGLGCSFSVGLALAGKGGHVSTQFPDGNGRFYCQRCT